MTFLPSKVHTGARSSPSTRNLKYVLFCFRSFSWSVRKVSGLARVVRVAIEFSEYDQIFYRVACVSVWRAETNASPKGGTNMAQDMSPGNGLNLLPPMPRAVSRQRQRER